jgi:hypothetical protein
LYERWYKLPSILTPAPDDMFLLYEMADELKKPVTSGDQDSEIFDIYAKAGFGEAQDQD